MHDRDRLNVDYIPPHVKLAINIISIIVVIFIIKGLLSFYFNVYKPEEKYMIRQTQKAYSIIQKELTIFYRNNGYVYNIDNYETDEFCEVLANKYSKSEKNCKTKYGKINYQKNFTLEKEKIEIWGMEKPPHEEEGALVKDFFIDINKEKGENLIGIDRIPMKIYSSGRLGGLILPVNCNHEDEMNFSIKRSEICPNDCIINFLANNKIFGYDILQIGGEQGKTRKLNRNVSFLRADCMAFGGELIAGQEFCDKFFYAWIPACYGDYPCAINFTTEQKI